SIKDVFYQDEFNLKIDGLNPKGGLYVFGYDWKKDNKITATLLTQLIGLILRDYEKENGCNIGKVNIVAHSMGGLVARAMLEDMCVNFDFNNKKNTYLLANNPEKETNGNIFNFPTTLCLNPYSSSTISKEIKVNKLVTIATPQRGSPMAFPIWEKGDIEMTDGFLRGIALKGQLGVFTSDSGLYKTIHGYDRSIPNGIVTIGQLLPDVKNTNSYNSDKLKYLLKDEKEILNNNYNDDFVKYFDINMIKNDSLINSTNYYYSIKNDNYPKNSFLEELNKTENIKKMFSKIDNKYIAYYSDVTGNDGLNNIVDFKIGDKYIDRYSFATGPFKQVISDNTYSHNGQDIYEYYEKNISDDYYLINSVIRNEYGLGGDGTVPTYNLKLVPNDSVDGREIENPKYGTGLVSCYINKPSGKSLLSFYSPDESYLESNIVIIKQKSINETYLYSGFGEIDKYQVCSHSNMPFATSIKVVDFFLDNNSNERNQLLTNFGKADYTYAERSIGGFDYGDRGIKNKEILSWLFDEYKYIKTISKNKISNDSFSNPIRFSLDLVDSGNVLRYDILSPIDIMITDEQGRRIGIDRDTGMIVNEIPGAWTSGRAGESGEREFFLIPGKTGEPINHKIE
ncbi:hypothetical protein EOM39_07380, partial [Candidatus Gracilibacteria bacterium]|nr:hypothetical protein [Candidatus Gracilibacteria bacterium]